MTALDYVYDDGGRSAAGFRGHAGDCVCRAVAIASGRPYTEVYAALAAGTGTERRGRGRVSGRRNSAREGIHVRRAWFARYIRSIGATWSPTMGIGTGCRVHLNADELPLGRLVVAVSKHYTAVIDHVIRDTHNPSERGTTVYPPTYPTESLPKGATWLENGNGWAYAPERCVYGYWKFA